MSNSDSTPVRVLYAYGYRGRSMIAIRAPMADDGRGETLIGRNFDYEKRTYRILAVRRQVTGPIAAGEPVGVEAVLV